MISKVKITDVSKVPLNYIKDLSYLVNNEINFKAGNNIIIGPNGSGKSTLLKLIEIYHLISDFSSDINNINRCLFFNLKGEIQDGVKVYSDYKLNVFKFSHASEMLENDTWCSNFKNFVMTFNHKHSSTGESVMSAMSQFLDKIFSSDTRLTFCIDKIKEYAESGSSSLKSKSQMLLKYYNECTVNVEKQYTLLLDEPDRNLDIKNINQITSILKTTRPDTQLICVIHNPLVIYELSKCKEINFIELEDGYLNSIKEAIDKLLV
jgi:predicted ATPase